MDHPYGDWERPDVLPFLPDTAGHVLDVGCSLGGFCRAVKRALPNAVVWGIEPNGEAAAAASQHADQVVHGYFPADLPDSAPSFDVIFFNDVLEHLVDPAAALAACSGRLASDGVVVASIPNVRYWLVLNKLLLKADFTYTETGVLDRTHLRFFTRSTMQRLFEDAGFHVELIVPLNISTYWKVKLVRFVLPRFGADISTPQYLIVGRPSR